MAPIGAPVQMRRKSQFCLDDGANRMAPWPPGVAAGGLFDSVNLVKICPLTDGAMGALTPLGRRQQR